MTFSRWTVWDWVRSVFRLQTPSLLLPLLTIFDLTVRLELWEPPTSRSQPLVIWCKSFLASGSTFSSHSAPLISLLIFLPQAGQVLLGVIALICRTFYAYRVYIVSKRKLLLPIIIMILSLASLGCALGAAITVFTKKYFSKFAEFTWGIST